MFKYLKGVVDKLSIRAIQERLDKRLMQQEMDTHRLFLLTSFYRDMREGRPSGGDEYVEKLRKASEELGYEGQRDVVDMELSRQALDRITDLHAAMLDAGDHQAETAPSLADVVDSFDTHVDEQANRPLEALKPRMQRVLEHRHVPTQHLTSTHAESLPAAAVADAMRERIGYSLEAGPSGIETTDAGNGLWLRGKAVPGQLLGFYPGVVYPQALHRMIPGFPGDLHDNGYLMTRYDARVVDALPWGLGQTSVHERWPQEMRNTAEELIPYLEGRNPLALVHVANHPPKGVKPNIMIAPYTIEIPLMKPWLRRYIPNIMFDMHTPMMLRDPVVHALAIVATTKVENEELMLNYRLSPHQPRPAWYHPVDAEEEHRRWA